MLLTVGMIVKNEEKYLERCLTALRPILENVDSELIVADTGSTDRTVQIARQFTDNVFFFEWVNDFAAARNATLEKARGQWFMFVDADEIFTSCNEIISFFNSGEYRKYNSASYIIRNLPKEGRGAPVDFTAPRLTRILPCTRFIHPVHECYNTYGEPVKALYDIAEHYGYTAENAEDKFKRNSILLLKRLRDEEPSAMLYQQLYDCFSSHDEEKAIEYLNTGISFCKENNHPLIFSMYHSKANHLFGEKKYSEALMVCQEYFGTDKTSLSTDVEMHGFMATCLSCLGRASEAVDEYARFFESFARYKSGGLATQDMRYTRFIISSDINISALFTEFLTACIRCGSDKGTMLADFPLYMYPVGGKRLSSVVSAEVEFLCRNGYADADRFYNNLPEDVKALFERLLRGKIAVLDSIAAINAFERLSPSNREAGEIYRRLSEGAEPAQLAQFLKNANPQGYADMLYIMVKKGADISTFVTAAGFSAEFCAECCYSNFGDFCDYASEYKAQYIKNPSAYLAASEFFGSTAKLAAADRKETTPLTQLYGQLKELSRRAEFENLCRKVKANIYSFMENKDFFSAEKILAEYEKLNPKDPDIQKFQAEIDSKRV